MARRPVPLTADKLQAQALELPPRGVLTYHIGFLAIDAAADRRVAAIAMAFRDLAKGGLGGLVQERMGEDRWRYQFVRSARAKVRHAA